MNYNNMSEVVVKIEGVIARCDGNRFKDFERAIKDAEPDAFASFVDFGMDVIRNDSTYKITIKYKNNALVTMKLDVYYNTDYPETDENEYTYDNLNVDIVEDAKVSSSIVSKAMRYFNNIVKAIDKIALPAEAEEK